MKDERDPFEILQEINPVDPGTLPDPARSPDALAVMESMLRGEFASPQGGRFRWLRSLGRGRRRIYLVPVVAAAVLGAGTLAWALSRGPTQHLTVGCYATADLDARTAVVSATDASPVEACRKLWLNGVFGQPPPPLQACVLPSGAVGVFPRADGDSCERLNLAPATVEPASAVVALQKALVDKFLRPQCAS